MAQNNFYYIGVMDSEVGMKFVTSIDKQNKMALWDKDKKPLALTQQTAKDYAEALAANLVPATVVRTFWELDNQPCWVMTEDEKNIDKLSSLVADVIKDVDDGVAKPWQIGIYCAAYNTDTFTISVHKSYGMSGIHDVRFVATERDKNGEFSAYEIQPTRRLWQVFRDTEENRELLVEQLENKTGKRFAFAEFDKPERVLERDYAGDDEELDLTAGNGRGR